MRTLTFKEWSAKGYRINKGSKSKTINEEFEATFTEKQVSKVAPRAGYETYKEPDYRTTSEKYYDLLEESTRLKEVREREEWHRDKCYVDIADAYSKDETGFGW